MKRRWKIFWTVCGITAAVGFACCIAALALGVTAEMIEGRFPTGFGIVSGGKMSSQESYTGVRKIDMDLSVGDVEVLPTDGHEVVVETEGISRRLGFTSNIKEDELEITSKKWSIFGSRKWTGKIYLYLPKEVTLEEISLGIDAGDLTVRDLWAEEFSLSVGTGNGRVENFTAREADIDCGAGMITASGCAGRTLELDCGVGEIEYVAPGTEAHYDYDINCGVGEVRIGSREYSGLGRSGQVNNGMERKIKIDCGVGSVTVDFDGGAVHDQMEGTRERHGDHRL